MTRPSTTRALRLRTWLAPSLPMALFEALAERIAAHTGRAVELTSDASLSGPRPWLDDPFANNEVDVGFLCSPSLGWLTTQPVASVATVAAHMVPLDRRASGQPLYFSDVIVPLDGARRLSELAGRKWAYNDPCSLSGWLALEAQIPDPDAYFGEVVQSGSHLESIRLVAEGKVDGAAIDSTVLGWMLAKDPELGSRFRVLESWGPHPIQPVVARLGLGPATIAAIGDALCSFDPAAADQSELAEYAIAGFASHRAAATADTRVLVVSA